MIKSFDCVVIVFTTCTNKTHSVVFTAGILYFFYKTCSRMKFYLILLNLNRYVYNLYIIYV